MEVTLTHGAIEKMLNEEVTSEKEMIPVMQVMELKQMASNYSRLQEGKRYWKVLLSDGTHLLHGMLSSTLTTFVEQGLLQTGYIVRLTGFACQVIQHRTIVIVLDLEVISTTSNIIRHHDVLGGPNPNDDTQDGEVVKQTVFEQMKDLGV